MKYSCLQFVPWILCCGDDEWHWAVCLSVLSHESLKIDKEEEDEEEAAIPRNGN